MRGYKRGEPIKSIEELQTSKYVYWHGKPYKSEFFKKFKAEKVENEISSKRILRYEKVVAE